MHGMQPATVSRHSPSRTLHFFLWLWLAVSFWIPTPTVLSFVISGACTPGTRHVGRLSLTSLDGSDNSDSGSSSGTSSTSTSSTSAGFRSLSQPNLVRGERYGRANSTLPSPEVIAAKLGVKPTREASAKTWQRAWKLHKRLIPLLHSTDGCKPPDSSLNLACMWWKALSGNDASSPVSDNGLAYDLLPSGWRRIVHKRVRRFYPRLHHGNVELRTAYLDDRITRLVDELKTKTKPKTTPRRHGRPNASDANDEIRLRIQLVCMGAGYDTRGVKMLERGLVDDVVELDLPDVVTAKERLFRRLERRRPWLLQEKKNKESTTTTTTTTTLMPRLLPSDFNALGEVEDTLWSVLFRDDGDDGSKCQWHTIFVFEGVMIYLDEGVPSALLGLTSRLLREASSESNHRGGGGSLCFADRLENVPGGELDAALKELSRNGWDLEDWSPKPGLARHMGSARLATAVDGGAEPKSP